MRSGSTQIQPFPESDSVMLRDGFCLHQSHLCLSAGFSACELRTVPSDSKTPVDLGSLARSVSDFDIYLLMFIPFFPQKIIRRVLLSTV